MSKRILCAVLCLVLLIPTLVSCGGDSQADVGVPMVKKAESAKEIVEDLILGAERVIENMLKERMNYE